MAHPKLSKKFVQFRDLILFEDDDILVVDKPLYMASLDDKSNRNLNHLAKLHNPDLQLCHRLDKNTSGILIMAKGPDNYREIALQFQRREIKKQYKTEVEKLIIRIANRFELDFSVAAIMLDKLVQSKQYIPRPISTYESMMSEGKWEVTSKKDLDKWRTEFYKMIASTYKGIGGHPNFKSPNDVNTSNANVYHDIDVDDDGEPDAIKGFKKK